MLTLSNLIPYSAQESTRQRRSVALIALDPIRPKVERRLLIGQPTRHQPEQRYTSIFILSIPHVSARRSWRDSKGKTHHHIGGVLDLFTVLLFHLRFLRFVITTWVDALIVVVAPRVWTTSKIGNGDAKGSRCLEKIGPAGGQNL